MMTRKEFDKLMDKYGNYTYGWDAATSDEEALICQKGMKDTADKIWTEIENASLRPGNSRKGR